jgi:hypothetical protein
MRLSLISIFVLPFILSGCFWKSFGYDFISLSKCDNTYAQTAKEASVVVNSAKQLEVQGKLTQKELIKVDQDAGMFSQRISTACMFFMNDKITLAEYTKMTEDAKNDYLAAKQLVASKEQ